MTTLAKYKPISRTIEERSEYLDKCFLVFRDRDFPLFLKPVKIKVETTCLITGKPILPGHYAYPCLPNPVRLTPFGHGRVHIHAALKKGNSILPAGYHATPIPTTEMLKERMKGVDMRRRLKLTLEANQLLLGV